MSKRIVAAIVVVVLLLVGYYAYMHYAAGKRLRDGEVTSDDVRDGDGNSVHATPSRSDTAGAANTDAVKATANPNTQSASLAQLQAQNNTVPATSASSTAPATDSQSPNAPNGVAFAGSGRFQVYRQGNLTWRVNTDNGSTCILFATEEEWRKPIVYSHGCGNS